MVSGLYGWVGELASGHEAVVLVRIVVAFEIGSERGLQYVEELAAWMVIVFFLFGIEVLLRGYYF